MKEIKPSWWVISEPDFLEALHRAHNGENPEIVYAEWYANSDHEQVPGKDET